MNPQSMPAYKEKQKTIKIRFSVIKEYHYLLYFRLTARFVFVTFSTVFPTVWHIVASFQTLQKQTTGPHIKLPTDECNLFRASITNYIAFSIFSKEYVHSVPRSPEFPQFVAGSALRGENFDFLTSSGVEPVQRGWKSWSYASPVAATLSRFWVRHVIPTASRVTKGSECGTRIPTLIWIIGSIRKSNFLNVAWRSSPPSSPRDISRTDRAWIMTRRILPRDRSRSIRNSYAIKSTIQKRVERENLDAGHRFSFTVASSTPGFVANRVMLQRNVNRGFSRTEYSD